MNLSEVNPTKESIKQLVADFPADTPVTMLNILRFKELTDAGESGLKSYQRYGVKAQEHVVKAGAKVVWAGEVISAVIGQADHMPHQVLLVEYPSVNAFLTMVLSKEYQAITSDRTMALQYGGLYACKTISK